MSVSLDYCHTVNSNIELFLRDKSNKMEIRLEEIKIDFKLFWHNVGAMGDLDAALNEFNYHYNASNPVQKKTEKNDLWFLKKIYRLIRKTRS